VLTGIGVPHGLLSSVVAASPQQHDVIAAVEHLLCLSPSVFDVPRIPLSHNVYRVTNNLISTFAAATHRTSVQV